MANRLLLIVVLLLSVQSSCFAQDKLSDEAQAVLTAAGVTRGVCIHLGSGSGRDPGLSAELASGNLHVHGLALDAEAQVKARAAIVKRDVAGLALVDRGSLAPLPYVPDIANLVVIEDWATLAAQGLTVAEVERVTAPGGAICIRKDGGWQRTIKARPTGMGDWTHTQGGPDRGWVSSDTVVRLPLGVRWQDGTPQSLNQRSDCRGCVSAGGRTFVLHINELENIPPFPNSRKNSKVEYLAAHDAFNGTLLWKIPCGQRPWFTEGLNGSNGAPLVTDGKRVFVAKEGSVEGLDAETGKQVTSSPVSFPTVILSLSGNMLVAAGWGSHDQKGWWGYWSPKTDKGAIEAFGVDDGALKWSLKEPAVQMLIDGNTVVALIQTSSPAESQSLAGIDLATGGVRWRVPHTAISSKADLHLSGIGAGVVAVDAPTPNRITVLSLTDGRKLWDIPAGTGAAIRPFTARSPVVDGQLWYGKSVFDLKTGSVVGSIPTAIGGIVCTPVTISPNLIAHSRDCTYMEVAGGKVAKTQKFSQRGTCILGAPIANGMLYAGQNLCHCATGQVNGFVGFGWNGDPPTANEFSQARPVERSPVAGVPASASNGTSEWPSFLHDATRSSATSAKLPTHARQLWVTPSLAKDQSGAFPEAWRSRLAQCLTAPVVSRSRVVVATVDRGEVFAFDLTSGKQVWRTLCGARIDSAPTLAEGLCVFGSHDGWITALRLTDGSVAWRARAAPREQRMMAFGQMESQWPVSGSVLVTGGTVYATVGRSSRADGGLGALALRLTDGATVWAKPVPSEQSFQNDLLSLRDGKLQLFHLAIDPATGGVEWTSRGNKHVGLNGMTDPSWTRVGPTFGGRSRYERILGELLAWNDKDLVVFDAQKPNRGFCAVLPVGMAKTMTPRSRKPDAIESANPDNEASEKATAETTDPKKMNPVLIQSLDKKDCRWMISMSAGIQPEAMALCGDVLVLAGRSWNEKQKQLGGFVWTVSMHDGKRLNEWPLESPPTLSGLAVVDDRMILTLQDGRVLCLGD